MADTPWFPRRNKNTKTATNPTTPQTVTEHVKLMFQPCKSNTSEKKTRKNTAFFFVLLEAAAGGTVFWLGHGAALGGSVP